MRNKRKAVIIFKIDGDVTAHDTVSQRKFSKCLFLTEKHDLCKYNQFTLNPMHFNEKPCKC